MAGYGLSTAADVSSAQHARLRIGLTVAHSRATKWHWTRLLISLLWSGSSSRAVATMMGVEESSTAVGAGMASSAATLRTKAQLPATVNSQTIYISPARVVSVPQRGASLVPTEQSMIFMVVLAKAPTRLARAITMTAALKAGLGVSQMPSRTRQNSSPRL